jgi:hypothetical protein
LDYNSLDLVAQIYCQKQEDFNGTQHSERVAAAISSFPGITQLGSIKRKRLALVFRESGESLEGILLIFELIRTWYSLKRLY